MKNKAKLDKSDCILSKHEYLFRVMINGGATHVLRALSFIEYWEWTVVFKALAAQNKSADERSSRNFTKFTWNLSQLEDLEEMIYVVMVRRICLQGERNVEFSSGDEFTGTTSDHDSDTQTDPKAVVKKILTNCNGFVTINDDMHNETHNLPAGSAVMSVDGARILRLPFASTLELLQNIPRKKPLKLQVRVPKSEEIVAMVKRSRRDEWIECSVEVGNMKVTFEASTAGASYNGEIEGERVYIF